MQAQQDAWHKVSNVEEVASPALLVYPDRVEENIQRMLRVAGGERLRPHVKTHKLPEVVRMQIERGITKFKCATIAEAEMTALCGATDVLLAYQPVGPNIARFIQLAKTLSRTKFSTIADDANVLRSLSAAAAEAGLEVDVLLDIDCGMRRSGVPPGPKAVELYRLIADLRGLKPGGFHAYEGQIQDREPGERARACERAFSPVNVLRAQLAATGLPVPVVVAGGTPTFPIHARRKDVECAPGTCVFWDFGYATRFPDLDFLPAALLLTRVVSKPGLNRVSLDLGHKAVASENPVTHSEEHLVVETARASEFPVGAVFYGIPWHICPTVALHSEAVVIKNGQAEARWKILARERKLTF